MRRWWLDLIQGFLQTSLDWIKALQGQRVSRDGKKLLTQDVHVPTPIVAVGSLAALFIVLLPKVGLSAERALALFVLLGLVLVFFVIYIRTDLPQFVHDDEAVFLIGLNIVLGVLLIEVGQTFPRIPVTVVPLASIVMLVTLLLHVRLAVLIGAFLSILAGVLNGFSLGVTLMTLFGTFTAIVATRNVRTRADIIRAGLHVAWVTALIVVGTGLIAGASWRFLLLQSGWALANGLLSAGITLAFLPFLEAFFSRITNITLLELGDFNRPLLRQLMLEAPGTYHHTLLVAALAEQAAEAIGANSLLARVGMYYHDIGKKLKPEYFIENQTMRRSPKEKPHRHDKIAPSISSLVILSHVKDGLALARAHNVPAEIAKFIPEHHGTSLIKYFYVQALEQGDEDMGAAESSFRYPGPKPRSKETAIGMMADSVEAASRALEEPTYERLYDLIQKIVFSKLEDGQFDECPLTVQDIRRIIHSFAQSLSAIYHVRIEYPELPKENDA